MSTGARIALAVGAGYMLGRRHKLRWAVTLAALTSTGQLARLPDVLTKQAARVLGSNPELGTLSQTGGRLLSAGRAAALAAVTNRMQSLSQGLQDRLGELSGVAAGGEGEEPAEEETPPAEGRSRAPRRRTAGDGRARSREPEEPEETEDEYEEEEPVRADSYEAVDEEPEEEPAPRRRRASSVDRRGGRSPVRRLRR